MNGQAGGKVLIGLALIVALVPLLWTWSSLLTGASTIVLMCACAGAVLALGMVWRALRRPEWAATPMQLIVLVGIVVWLANSLGVLGKLPATLTAGVRQLLSSGVPLTPGVGVTLLACLAAGVLAILADWLAIVLERPVAAIVPLIIALLVPSLGPKVHTPPIGGMWLFALGVACLLLAASRPTESGARSGRLRMTAAVVATATTVATLALALALAPLVRVPPSTRGSDGQPIQMSDISLQLKREISQGADTPAFDYTTTDGRPAYLRLYSLPTFNGDGWHLTDSVVQVGPLAAPPGATGGTSRRTSVTITGLKSEWLPVPYAPISTTAGDRWGYLADSLAILALGMPDRTSATQGKSYTVDSLDVRPTAEQLAAVQAGTPPDAALTASVPSDISGELVRLARSITADAPTAGAKAQAILAYLAQPEFKYSLDSQPGSGYRSIEDFLLRDRKGFCVQYAASMAILARAVGIPSRVAIGFTPGTRVGDHWTVTMHDMHAWPELYLDGFGWVSFDPTPGTGSPDTGTSPAPSTPSVSPSAAASQTATPSAAPTVQPDQAASAGRAFGGVDLMIWLLVAGVAALVLAAPALIRGRRRRTRLAPGRDPATMALDALDEIRATALDLGRTWPTGSPRYAAAEASGWVSGEAADGVRALGLAAERARFGGPDHRPETAEWAGVAAAFRAELTARTPSRGHRLRARLLPASLLS